MSYCVACDRLFCSHTGARYEDARFAHMMTVPPVETTSGERARQLALGVLTKRHAALDERSRAEFRFSEIERQHMEALAGTIHTLTGMAPERELRPPAGSLDLGLAFPQAGSSPAP